MDIITKGLTETLKKFKRKKLFVHEPDIRSKDFNYLKIVLIKRKSQQSVLT